MAFKSSAPQGSYSQVIDGNVAFSKTKRLQNANQVRAQQRQRHTKLLADRNRDNLNSLKAAHGVEGQSRQLALNDQKRLLEVQSSLESQRTQAAYDSAVRNAEAKADRSIAAAKELEGFINKAVGTGLDIYQRDKENRLKQEKNDLAGLTLKYGLSATDLAGIRSMSNEAIQHEGVREGLAFKLRQKGMTTAEFRQINGASKLAIGAVAYNAAHIEFQNLHESFFLSQEPIPGFNKTPAQLLQEDGSPEAIAALRAEYNRHAVRVYNSLEGLNLPLEGLQKPYSSSQAAFNSIVNKGREAYANQQEDIEANQSVQFWHKGDGVINGLGITMEAAAASGGGQAAIAAGQKYIRVIGQQIEQGLLPAWLADELPNMKILGTNFTLGTHGAYGEQLLEAKKAARRYITGEHTDRRRAAEAAQYEWEENLWEFALQSKSDMVGIMAATRKRLLKLESEGVSTNWMAKMASMEAIYNKTPTIRTPTQRLFHDKVNQDNGSYALQTHAEIRQTFQTPKEQNDALSKLMKDRHTYNSRVLNPQIERLANPLMKQGSPEFKAHWTVGWMKQDATKRFWADATRYRMQGMSPEDAKTKALANLATDFKVAEDNKFTGHYGILDVNKSGGKVGFAGAWKEWGDAMSVGGGVGNTYKEIVDIFDNNTLKKADLSNWEITADQLKDQLNPNTPNSTFVMGRVAQAMRLTGYKGGMNDAMVELITNSTGQQYIPPEQTIEMSDTARAVYNRLESSFSLPGNTPTYAIRGSGGNIRYDYIQEDGQTAGYDLAPTGSDYTHALFPGRVIQISHQYNPTGIGGDGRPGVGWGHHVIIRHTNPNSGEEYDMVYAHFPKNGIQVRVGQTVTQGQILGPMATDDQFTNDRANVGSGRGVHMSVDMYEKDSNTPYRNWRQIGELIRGSGRGGQQSQPQQPEPISHTQSLNIEEIQAADPLNTIEASTGDVTTATGMQSLFETKGGHTIFIGNDGKFYVKKPGEVLRTEISEQMMKAYQEDSKAGTVRAVLGGNQ